MTVVEEWKIEPCSRKQVFCRIGKGWCIRSECLEFRARVFACLTDERCLFAEEAFGNLWMRDDSVTMFREELVHSDYATFWMFGNTVLLHESIYEYFFLKTNPEVLGEPKHFVPILQAGHERVERILFETFRFS